MERLEKEPSFQLSRQGSFTTCMLFINFLKHLFTKFLEYPFSKKNCFRKNNSMVNLDLLEHIRKHL